MKNMTINDAYEIGVAQAEDAVTQAAKTHRAYLRSRGAERCEECGHVTCTPVWVTRRYLCRECARVNGRTENVTITNKANQAP